MTFQHFLSQDFGAKTEIDSDRMFLQSKFEKIEKLLHDFVLCLASQSNKDVCLYDYQIPSSKGLFYDAVEKHPIF